jgi:alpha-glucosidase
MYVRGGAIVPTGPVVQYAGEKALEEITLLVCLDEAGKAGGVLYEDAGEGWGFKNGEFRLTTFAAEKNGQEVSVKVVRTEGEMAPLDRKIVARVIVPGMEVLGYGTEKTGASVMVVEPVVRPGR